MRTSQSHPLMIDCFSIGKGRVGMTLCPGRTGPSALGPDWARDLAADVLRLKLWRTDILVSLTEADEMARMGVSVRNMDAMLREAGIQWFHLPIPDDCAPEDDWHEAWCRLSPALHQRLEAGGRVAIHCKAGLERTALVAALLQCERGEPLVNALKVVRLARKGARPLPAQHKWLTDLIAEDDPQRQMIRASLFGGAIGDALGAEIEFWSLDRILACFPNGVDRILPHDGIDAAITDDTQMTLFTAEGLICAVVRSLTKGIASPSGVVHHALLRWLVTQGETGQITDLSNAGLIRDPRLHRRRAPGLTCLAALRASQHFGDLADNDSKGCGTIMRVAPIGLFCEPEQIDEVADSCSHLTHGHRTGRDAARALAHLLAMILRGRRLQEALDTLLLWIDLDEPTSRALQAALDARPDGRPGTVEALGGGWVAEEALAIALYAARVAESFEHGLQIAVTHSGDSDSTGAIAGNLLGLMYPDEVMAHPWRAQIQCADRIDRLANDLAAARRPDREFARRMWDFYPGW